MVAIPPLLVLTSATSHLSMSTTTIAQEESKRPPVTLSRVLRSRLLWYALLVVIPGFLYWRTLLHGVGFWGDSAKFQFVGKVLGTPHAPGYPLYVMLNYLFVTLVPWGSLATRANLLSAVFTLLTILIFFEILLLLKLRPYAAFITALAFGLSTAPACCMRSPSATTS
jgi:hypothetical protein